MTRSCSTMLPSAARLSFVVLSMLAIAASGGDVKAGNVLTNYYFQGLGTTAWQVNAISDVSDGPVVAVGQSGTAGSIGLRWTQSDGFEVLGQSNAKDVSGDGNAIVGGGGAASGAAYLLSPDGVDLLPSSGSLRVLAVSRDGKIVSGSIFTEAGSQPFYWYAENQAAGIQLVANYEGRANGTAYDVAHNTQAGTVWTVGDTISPTSGSGAGDAVISRNDEPYFLFAHNAARAVAITLLKPAPEETPSIPLVVVNDSTSPYTSEVKVWQLADEQTNAWSFQTLGKPYFSSTGTFSERASAHDISTDGRIIVGETPTQNGNAVYWERDPAFPVWGISTVHPGAGSSGVILADHLAEKLPPSIFSDVDFANWRLSEATGVTVEEKYLPALASTLYTSHIVGNGTAPSDVRTPWMASAYAIHNLQVEDLLRIPVPGGTFEPSDSAWTVTGDGVFDFVLSSAGDGMAGQLTTETELSISQFINTPDELFILALDVTFLSQAGSFQVSLDGMLLAECTSEDFSGSEDSPVAMLVAYPDLLGRTGIELTITTFGGSTGQIVIDNVSISTAVVPEPTTLMLTIMGFVSSCLLSRRRQSGRGNRTSHAS